MDAGLAVTAKDFDGFAEQLGLVIFTGAAEHQHARWKHFRLDSGL